MKIVQVNLHHSKSASAVLQCFLLKANIDIALIQEPWVNQGRVRGLSSKGWEVLSPTEDNPRACIIARKTINLLPLWGFCCRDLMVASFKGRTDIGERDLIIGSAYLPYDQLGSPPTTEVVHLVEACKGDKEILLGCDSNAHHILWGSSDTNTRGESLLEYLISNNLEVLNRGNEPTFVISNRREVIDITIGTPVVCTEVENWHVSQETTLSDHRYIRFDVFPTSKSNCGSAEMYRNPRTCDWDLFKEYLTQGVRDCPSKAQNAAEVELMTECITSAIKAAYENSCPLREARMKRQVPWWNSHLESLKHKTRKLFNRAKRTGEWGIYKISLTEYHNEVRRSKRSSWRKYCEDVEKTSECAKLQKALQREQHGKIGSLQDERGEYTVDEEGTLEHLLRVHFPGSRLVSERERANTQYLGSTQRGTRGDWKLANKIVNITKLEWAINSFEPFKSPGVDGIFPVLLQRGFNILASPLCTLLRSSLATGYVPNLWRKVKVVFIPKPGRPTYAQAKSFRPISLSSFLLKTLEKMIDVHIRDDVMRNNALHRYQYAYQTGKSCELAIHELTSRIEKTLDNHEMALGIFMDIEGAFDCTSFNSIKNTVEKRGVSPSVSRWISNSLEHRIVTTSLNSITREVSTTRGCPQGGVLSPLLWNLVVDELLEILDKIGVHAQGYADDITILTCGKYGNIILEMAQQAMAAVESWCKKEGLTVNPTKTSTILFTRRRKNQNLANLKLFDREVPREDHVKYLGITIDAKLTFQLHIQKAVDKATRALWTCRNIIGKTWGLKPRNMHWLYTRVVRPTITYAALIFWHKTSKGASKNKLGKLQRIACLAITGGMKTTPTAAMEVLLDLPPLHLVIEAEALSAAYRLKNNGYSKYPLTKKGHANIFQEIEKNHLLSMRSDRIRQTLNLNKHYKVTIPNRAEGLGETYPENREGTVWYTDGSKMESGTGAGIWEQRTGHGESLTLGTLTTVFQAEVIAISHCAETMIEKGYLNRRIHIMSDSQGALKALNSSVIRSAVVVKCVKALSILAERNKVTLEWVPGHEGVPGNEEADTLARRAAKTSLVGPEPTCGISIKTAKREIKNRLRDKHCQHWHSLPGLRQSRMFIHEPSETKTKCFLNLHKKHLRWATGIFTGHCQLREHLTLMGLEKDSDCRFCQEEEESPSHILCHCETLKYKRQWHFGAWYLEPSDFADAPIKVILDFFEETGVLNS